MSKAAAPPTTSSGSTKGHQRLDVIAEAIKVKVGRCLCKSEGDRRGSNPHPSEPQSDVIRFSPSYHVRLLGLFKGFSAISQNAVVCCVPARTSPVAVRLQ
jgi:hypothetical protein